MPPRARRPVGVVLLDKPAGPSSFALVATLRRRTGARTGHTGTLDPFASGLLVLLSGAATRLAPCFVALDKRYVTDVELTATTTTRDPEGDEVELRIPAASAVKIGGERAYRRARRGEAPAMPLRRSRIDELRLLDYDGETARLELHVTSGTYVRSVAEALGGHCRTLRRTAVGPFSVDEADPERLRSVAEVLGRLPAEALSRVPGAVRAGVLAVESGGTAAPQGLEA
jgi:tRNA pseudouridine55 synthase